MAVKKVRFGNQKRFEGMDECGNSDFDKIMKREVNLFGPFYGGLALIIPRRKRYVAGLIDIDDVNMNTEN